MTLSDSADKVTISSSISYKYGLKKGDVITLKDEENGKLYAFEIEAVTQYAPSFMVLLPYDKALDLFGEQDDYYNVVFADHDLGVESGRLYSTLTRDDVKKSAGIFADQIRSMIITIAPVSALIISNDLIKILKIMIVPYSFSIALIKIFGYRNKEVKKMYLDGNFYIVLIGALVSIPLAKVLLDAAYEPQFVPNIACGVDKSFPVWLYLAMLAGVLVLYFIVVYFFKKGKFNPTVGIAGVSCVPSTAKVAQKAAAKANPAAFILDYALGANICGVITTAILTGIYITLLS